MTTTLIIYTSGPAAVRTCSSAGWHRLDLDLSSWTADERAWLAARTVDTDRGPKICNRTTVDRMRGVADSDALVVAPPTADRLHEIVREELAERADKLDGIVAQAIAEIAEARVAPISALSIDAGASSGPSLKALPWSASSYGIDELELAQVRARVGTDKYGYVALADLGRLDEYRAHCEAERAAESQRAAEYQAERAAEQSAREAQHAADRAKLREILIAHADDHVAVYDAGMARDEDIDEALRNWACSEIGVDSERLSDHAVISEIGQLDPTHYRSLVRTREAAAKLGATWLNVTAARGADSSDEIDDDDASELLVLVRADVAGRRIYLEIPIEHTPIG